MQHKGHQGGELVFLTTVPPEVHNSEEDEDGQNNITCCKEADSSNKKRGSNESHEVEDVHPSPPFRAYYTIGLLLWLGCGIWWLIIQGVLKQCAGVLGLFDELAAKWAAQFAAGLEVTLEEMQTDVDDAFEMIEGYIASGSQLPPQIH